MARFNNPYTKDQIVFASAARTTHNASPEIGTGGGTGIVIDLNVTAFTGTSITFTLQFYDNAAGAWATLLASAAISATGRSTLTVDPRIAASANVSAQTGIRRRMRLLPSGTITSVTYSAYSTIIP